MPESRSSIPPSEDTITILITTDNHVGYKENDPVMGDDAWKTLEEIMSLAAEREVDMVLQAGDLFHINKPSKKSLFQVMRILRMHCLGDKPVELELLNDPAEVFDDGFNTVNYEDPNYNISIPVFAIAGNHDDSTGDNLLSPMDVLSVTGLINHFGRVLQNDNIEVTPALLQKGTTKLALFGMASVIDERLYRTFRDGNVKFKVPPVKQNEWFNLMAVHQNHHAHTDTSYLPEEFLPNFLDLVVWGHEHECIPYTVTNYEAGFETLQPGSSVATSLSEAETTEKNIFILTIKNKDYHVEPIKLKTVRPFVMEDVKLENSGIIPGPTSKPEVTRYLASKVEQLIEKAKDKWKNQNPELFETDPDDEVELENEKDENQELKWDKRYPLPLIRLRVDYTGGYEVENPRRFSNMFVGRVANVNDIISFHRKRVNTNNKNIKLNDINLEENAGVKVQTYVKEFLQEADLTLLPENGLNSAMRNFVDKEDKQAIESFVRREIKNDINLLSELEVSESNKLMKYIKSNKKNFSSEGKDIIIDDNDLATEITKGKKQVKSKEMVDDSDLDKEDEEPKKRKRAVVKGRKAPAKKARKTVEVEESEDEEMTELYPPKRTAKKSRAPKKVVESFVTNSESEFEKSAEEVVFEEVIYEEEEEIKPKRKPASRGRGRGSKTTRGSRSAKPKTTKSSAGGGTDISSLLSQFNR